MEETSMEAKFMYVEIGTVGNPVAKICLDANTPMTIGQLLEKQNIKPAKNGIYLNKRLAKATDELKDGDKLVVVPQVTGG